MKYIDDSVNLGLILRKPSCVGKLMASCSHKTQKITLTTPLEKAVTDCKRNCGDCGSVMRDNDTPSLKPTEIQLLSLKYKLQRADSVFRR